MFTLNANVGASTTLRALRFVCIRLASRPDTLGLVPPVEAARARLRAALEAAAELGEQSAAATAEIVYRDSVEDDAVASLAREVRVLLGGDNKDERWSRLFSQNPSELTRPVAGPQQALHVSHILMMLRTDSAYTSLTGSLLSLEAARAGVEAAERARDALTPALYAAENERRTALDAAKRTYNRLKPQVQLLMDNPAQVRSFFPHHDRGPKEEDG
jgi:hypothetical protein